MKLRSIFSLLIAAFCWLAGARAAHAAKSVYVMAIGYNGVPPARSVTNEARLQYADDDAVAFYQFAREFSRDGSLLTVMDADTQGRFPGEVSEARPPTLAELRTSVQRLHRRLEEDRQRGDESVLLFFYSGHGSRPSGAPPALTLLDGALTHDTLYDEVLSAMPARYIHVFIDACYAEAIVRPRDADAMAVDVSAADMAQYAARATLARFPNVGALIAASLSSQTHEWDGYRHGVFTHQLLSGLRGAADVNLDKKVEYSELYAFLSAANRNVADARARLSVVVRAPGSNARAAIVDLDDPKSAGRVTDIPSRAGHVHFEDQFGNRLADIRVENGAKLALTLPAQKVVYIRSRLGEAELHLGVKEALSFERVSLAVPTARVRGALELAMKRGLFATGFGPNYYRGFIDQLPDFVAVPLADSDAVTTPAGGASVSGPDAIESTTTPWRAARALYLGGGVTESVGRGLGAMMAVRLGMRPRDPAGFTVTLDGAWGQSAFAEWRALGSVGYRFGFRKNKLVAFAGLEVGGGVAGQKTTTNTTQGGQSGWTAAFLAAPGIGASYQLVERVAVGFEANLNVMIFRRDDKDVAALPLPSAHIGVVMDL